jgi:hypothetical protein
MVDYWSLPALSGVYLEESYVLAISQTENSLALALDAVLTPDHPAYHPPRAGERYCYERGLLTFDDVVAVEWTSRSSQAYSDATGEKDLGGFDALVVTKEGFIAEGDWGRVVITGPFPRFELDE